MIHLSNLRFQPDKWMTYYGTARCLEGVLFLKPKQEVISLVLSILGDGGYFRLGYLDQDIYVRRVPKAGKQSVCRSWCLRGSKTFKDQSRRFVVECRDAFLNTHLITRNPRERLW